MKKEDKTTLQKVAIILIIIILIFLSIKIMKIAFKKDVPLEKDSIVLRKFSSTSVAPGEEIKVTLVVAVRGDETYYAVEEYIPDDWVVTNDGGGPNLRWVVIQDAKSTIYSYDVKAPDKKGNYYFNGIYMFEDFNGPKTTGGKTIVTVN